MKMTRCLRVSIVLAMATLVYGNKDHVYVLQGCFLHSTGTQVREWDTSGMSLEECAAEAGRRDAPWFVTEFPQGYSSLFETPAASCGFGGTYWIEGNVEIRHCASSSRQGLYLGGPSLIAAYVREIDLAKMSTCEKVKTGIIKKRKIRVEEYGDTVFEDVAACADAFPAKSLGGGSAEERGDIVVAYWPEDRPNQFEMLDRCGESASESTSKCRRWQGTDVRAALVEADVVFFSTDGLRVRLPQKRPGQYFASITAQGRPFLFNRMDDRSFADAMDLHFHYDPQRADVWLPWLPCRRRSVGGLSRSDFLDPPVDDEDLWTRSFASSNVSPPSSAFIATFVSNCALDRLEMIERLERFDHQKLRMDHYGKCNRNVAMLKRSKSEKEGGTYESAFREKLQILGGYRMTLVFENVRGVRHYVTEKIFHALAAGSLPIYAGAPSEDVERLLPCRHCVVYADHFDTTESLAKYLVRLTTDREEYLSYFHWKRTRALLPSFVALMDYCEKNFYLQQGCMACERVLDLRNRVKDEEEKTPLRFVVPKNQKVPRAHNI
eukprot:g5243.t1